MKIKSNTAMPVSKSSMSTIFYQATTQRSLNHPKQISALCESRKKRRAASFELWREFENCIIAYRFLYEYVLTYLGMSEGFADADVFFTHTRY